MPGCRPGDMARVIGGPIAGALVHVDRKARRHDVGWCWYHSRCWFVVTLLQPPPERDALGDIWMPGKLSIAGDEGLEPIRPGDCDEADPRDVLVPTESVPA